MSLTEFITRGDLIAEIGEETLVRLSDVSGTGEENTERVNAALVLANSTVESYLRGRYTFPLADETKRDIKSRALDIAIFRLGLGRLTGKGEGGEYDIRERANDDALKFLKDVQAGKAQLSVPLPDTDGDGTSDPVPPLAFFGLARARRYAVEGTEL